MAITTRAGKGSALTWTEADTNFTELQTGQTAANIKTKVESLTGENRIDATAIKNIPKELPTGGTTGQVLAKTNGTDYVTQWVDQETLTAAEIRDSLTTLSGDARLDASAIKNIPSGGGSDLGWINVKDFGATGDGVTDDTIAIQTAANTITEDGGILYFPTGTYLVTDSIELDNPTKVLGTGGAILQNDEYPAGPSGKANSVIQTNSPTISVFVVESDRCSFKDIAIYNTHALPTAGHGILFNRGQLASIQNCSIFRFFVNVEFVHGYLWAIDTCFFWGAVTFNLIIDNDGLGDAGDSTINNSWLYAGLHAGMTHIKYKSSGGLKINSTKFNMQGIPALHCIDAPIEEQTIILQVVNCSFENFNGHGIRVKPVEGVSFGNVIILGNEFAQSTSPTGNCISASGFNFVIDNNIFNTVQLGTNDGTTFSGYSIYFDSSNTTIGSGNVFNTPDGSQNISAQGFANIQVNRLTGARTISDTGGTLFFEMDKSNFQQLTLTRDVNMRIHDQFIGDTFTLKIKQDATGGHTLNIYDTTTIGVRSINLAPNSYTILRGKRTDDLGPVITIDNYLDLGALTTSGITALGTVYAGSFVYDTTLNVCKFYNGTDWETLSTGSGGSSTGWVNVKDFGALGDGTTDDSGSIQDAADSIGSEGGVLYFPPGNYLAASSITLSNPITVMGCGGMFPRTYPDSVVLEAISSITSNSATLDLFIIDANHCKFDSIALFNVATTPTAGHGIKLNKSTGFQIVGCSIAQFFVNINFIGGQLWSVDRCMFYAAVSIDMQISNTEVGGGDSGDQNISNSWFYGNDGATQLKYLSGGGLKITNTKFNSSELGQAAVAIDAPINIATVDLLISNCSIENFTDYGIHLHPSVAFNNVVISGNQLAGHNPIYVDGVGLTMVANNVINGTNDTALIYVIGANCVVGVNSLSNQSSTPDVVTDSNNQVVRRTNNYTIPTASTIKFDPNKGLNQFYILTADTNLNDFPYYNWGDIFQLTVKQNATGGWNLILPSYWRIVGSLNKEPNSITVIKAYRDVVFNDYSVIMDNQTSFVNPMTTVEKATLPSLRKGTLLYDKTLDKMTVYNGSTWDTLGSGSGSNNGWANVKDYGAIGDGTADDTTAIQDAIDANLGAVFFPPGKYLTTGGLVVDERTSFFGSGGITPFTPLDMGAYAISTILCNSATADLFTINADNCMFRDLAIYNTVTATAGHGILLNKSVGFRMNNCSAFYFYDNWEFVNGWDWHIDGCINFNPKRYGIKIADEVLPDAGDSCISNSWFYGNGSLTVTLLKYTSGGGLKLNNVKFNGAGGIYKTAIDIEIDQSTVIFMINNCSIENCYEYNIKATTSGAGSFNTIIITGNQFSNGNGTPIHIDGQIETVTITGNEIANSGSGFPRIYARVNALIIGHNNYGNITAGTNLFDLGTSNTVQVQRNKKIISLSGATPVYDLNVSAFQYLPLSTNATMTFANLLPGEEFTLLVYQDGIGGFTLNFTGATIVSGTIDLIAGSYSIVKGFNDSPLLTISS